VSSSRWTWAEMGVLLIPYEAEPARSWSVADDALVTDQDGHPLGEVERILDVVSGRRSLEVMILLRLERSMPWALWSFKFDLGRGIIFNCMQCHAPGFSRGIFDSHRLS